MTKMKAEVSHTCEECGASFLPRICAAGFAHSVVCEKCHDTVYPLHMRIVVI